MTLPSEPVKFPVGLWKKPTPKWRIVKRPSRINPRDTVFAVQERVYIFFWHDLGGNDTYDDAMRKLITSKQEKESIKRKVEVVFESE